jgi:hypothetical protein
MSSMLISGMVSLSVGFMYAESFEPDVRGDEIVNGSRRGS